MPMLPLTISSATPVVLADRLSSTIRDLPEEIAEPPPRLTGWCESVDVAADGVRVGKNGGVR